MNNPDAIVRIAAKMDAFLNDEDVDAAWKDVAKRYYEEFRAATSSELRMQAWSKAKALEDILLELRIPISAGERAVADAARNAVLNPRK
jgi:hypothetical protein